MRGKIESSVAENVCGGEKFVREKSSRSPRIILGQIESLREENFGRENIIGINLLLKLFADCANLILNS